jgi:imidazolonepropionase-like amidohydrolase
MRIFSALVMAAAIATPAAAETVLIRDGRVVTNGAAGIIENGDVLIVDGRISAVGANIAAPRGARVVERGKVGS